MFLPDINLWLAWAFDSHVHHASANGWFKAHPAATFSFCRLTQQGFLRLATNPKVFKDEAVSLQTAWTMYDTILADPRIAFAEEPKDLEAHWRANTQSGSFAPNYWSDAYLAAFAQAGNLEVVTFDKGFSRYQNVKCTILS